jgi:hypothetical protein
MSSFWFSCTTFIAAACISYACKTLAFKARVTDFRSHSAQRSEVERTSNTKEATQNGAQNPESELDEFKKLYFKLHNLERFYDDILPKVASILWAMISEAIDDAVHQKSCGILDIGTYSVQALEQFVHAEHDACMSNWEDYNTRRKAGGHRELFMSCEDASNSIRRLAPLRLVDGAWLAHVNKIRTPIALRSVMQSAWQILSEELGDGDLRKNHVHVYHELIRETSGTYLEPHSPLFIDSHNDMPDVHV